MNCEDYRQSIAVDPSFDGGAAHLGECAACQAYRSEMQALDQAISRALALDVPELQLPELPEPKSDNVVALLHHHMPRPMWLALAATVILAAFVGLRMTGIGVQYDSLADQLLAHIDHEPGAFRNTVVPVSAARLESAIAKDIARMDYSVGLITYAQSCKINGRDVPHLVIQGERGPVTILLMPHEMVTEPESIRGESVNGVILPVGDGSIAIFGERDERLDQIEKRILDSVTWST